MKEKLPIRQTLTDASTETIKENLKSMMYDTSVTIVIVSPNFKQSKWIDWEIEYCLREYSRKGRTSKTNGVVGVIEKVNGGYDWLVTRSKKSDGCSVRTIDFSKLYQIINKNRYNRSSQEYACNDCKTYDQLGGSYISLIDEKNFLNDPGKYIENAHDKSEESDEFDLTKTKVAARYFSSPTKKNNQKGHHYRQKKTIKNTNGP